MIKYKDAYNSTIDYFNGDSLATKVFLDKYALRDSDNNLVESNPSDMHHRLAKELARIEYSKFKNPLSEDEIFNYLDRFKKIVPQGSVMYGVGNIYQYVSIANCFVCETPLDDYGSILHTDEQIVQISKRRGGVGTDISNLRPAGTTTSNASKSSTGIVSFMERYSNSIREVGQSGRRGALLLTLSVHHPEILNFVRAKHDTQKITGANISVRLTDEFMEAVVNDTEYQVRWPVDSKTPKITKQLKAKEVWAELIHSVWLSAEPGLLFWDNIQLTTPSECYEDHKVKCLNPCLPKSANILTPKGLSTIEDISVGDKIWSESGWTTIVNKQSSGLQEVYKYQTTTGSISCTKEHKIVSSGEKIQICDAEQIDILTGPTVNTSDIDQQDVMDGLVLGDGSVHKASNNLVHLCIGDNDKSYFSDNVAPYINKHRPGLHSYAYEITTTLDYKEVPKTYNRKIPYRFLCGSNNKKCGLLRGLFSANGYVVGGRVCLKAASFKIIEGVQLMLSSLGIRSYYTTNKGKRIKFSNGTYKCKISYDINITLDREKFYELIGFIQPYKTLKLEDVITNTKFSSRNKISYDIKGVDFVGIEEVFDITVDNESHTFWCNGFNISNCGELILSELDSCRLLLLNTYSYVDSPFTKNASFNFNSFYEDVQIAQHLMDDIVDIELEHIGRILAKINSDPESADVKERERKMWEKIAIKCESGRRTGTGVTAIGDTLAALGLTYGSHHSVKKVEKIYRTLKLGCYRSSVDMSQELGAFPDFDKELEKHHPFLNAIKNDSLELNDGTIIRGKDIWKDMQKYGRRNIALITTSPAGSVSILTQTTSGIEPLFQKEYIRRQKITDNSITPDFVDKNGDKWQNHNVIHPKIQTWMDTTDNTNLDESPWKCANEINWKQRVKLQAAAQEHVCHSISSTINLPADVTEQEVSEIYEEAWKSGVKGITIYRQGCRDGVLIDAIPVEDKSSRPRTLPCDVHHISVKGTEYFVLVGLWSDGSPYEVFAGKNGCVGHKVKSGNITRKRKNVYKFNGDDDETELSPITAVMSDMEETISRLTSGLLRSGADMNFIVDQLEKVGGGKAELNNFGKCMARALKKYIADNTPCNDSCPECSGQMTRIAGCPQCVLCGFSKCS